MKKWLQEESFQDKTAQELNTVETQYTVSLGTVWTKTIYKRKVVSKN